MRGSIGLKKRRSFLVPQLCFDPIGKNLVEKSESLECWILRIVIRSWALDFYNEVGFRHLIRSKGAIGIQVEEKGGDLESHGVVCEHDWKKTQTSKN